MNCYSIENNSAEMRGKLAISIDISYLKRTMEHAARDIIMSRGGKLFGGSVFNDIVRAKAAHEYWTTTSNIVSKEEAQKRYGDVEFFSETSDRLIGYKTSDIDAVVLESEFNETIDALKAMSPLTDIKPQSRARTLIVNHYSWCSAIAGVQHVCIMFRVFKMDVLKIDLLTSTNPFGILKSPVDFVHNGLVLSEEGLVSRVPHTSVDEIIDIIRARVLVGVAGTTMLWRKFYSRYTKASREKGMNGDIRIGNFRMVTSRYNTQIEFDVQCLKTLSSMTPLVSKDDYCVLLVFLVREEIIPDTLDELGEASDSDDESSDIVRLPENIANILLRYGGVVTIM